MNYPFSSRSIRNSPRAQINSSRLNQNSADVQVAPNKHFPAINRKQIVTKEEIMVLKSRRNELSEEKKLLKTKIARLQVQTKKIGKLPHVIPNNTSLLEQLQKEYNILENLISSQTQKIRDIKISDNACYISELKEEAIVVHNERLRLQDIQIQMTCEVNKSQEELEDLIRNNSYDVIEKQREKMKKYEEKLAKYKKVNKRLAKKVKVIRRENAQRANLEDAQLEHRKQEILLKIREVRRATKNYEKKLENSKIEHAENVKIIKEKFGLE
ncbi:hypothetical protein TRFO_29563 [Tritrichomonas foetus]|uniref:Uncharacterized protein n=1 Tax=Tritrichomonas foetus TaxID=1144522 RepID=A0A1J4JVE5_9EUKA|nr:hypothetical protein TRFO_29563 [Tritrichomonas foetus]|eukprot:OHT03097.1 hypothetical protein TRFO_29563 [Tritrichomonas foetus]